MVVLHFTGMESAEAASARLCDPDAAVSSHYLITAQGETHQLVPEELRAWHAGAGRWGNVDDVNSRSIGIELDNDGHSPFPAPLMDALETLLDAILARWNVRPERVIAHSDCAPGRKDDPGPRFDWARLARAGVAIAVTPDPSYGPGTDRAFVEALGACGYTASPDPRTLLGALRLRHRPHGTGARDAVDMGLALALARRFAVDRGGDSA